MWQLAVVQQWQQMVQHQVQYSTVQYSTGREVRVAEAAVVDAAGARETTSEAVAATEAGEAASGPCRVAVSGLCNVAASDCAGTISHELLQVAHCLSWSGAWIWLVKWLG